MSFRDPFRFGDFLAYIILQDVHHKYRQCNLRSFVFIRFACAIYNQQRESHDLSLNVHSTGALGFTSVVMVLFTLLAKFATVVLWSSMAYISNKKIFCHTDQAEVRVSIYSGRIPSDLHVVIMPFLTSSLQFTPIAFFLCKLRIKELIGPVFLQFEQYGHFIVYEDFILNHIFNWRDHCRCKDISFCRKSTSIFWMRWSHFQLKSSTNLNRIL